MCTNARFERCSIDLHIQLGDSKSSVSQEVSELAVQDGSWLHRAEHTKRSVYTSGVGLEINDKAKTNPASSPLYISVRLLVAPTLQTEG